MAPMDRILTTLGINPPICNIGECTGPCEYRFPPTDLTKLKIVLEGTNPTLATQAVPRKKVLPALQNVDDDPVIPLALAASLALWVYLRFAMQAVQ